MSRRTRRRQRARDIQRRRENQSLPPDIDNPILGPVADSISDKIWLWYVHNHWNNKKMPRIVHFFFRWIF